MALDLGAVADFARERLDAETFAHSRRVALAVRADGYAPDFIALALLHDVAEDSDDRESALAEIRAEFGDDLAANVDAITQRDGETYGFEYIAVRVLPNVFARIVKTYDIRDNLARGFHGETERQRELIDEAGGVVVDDPSAPGYTLARRYQAALAVLTTPSEERPA